MPNQNPVKLQCLIVDDESMGRKLLEEYVLQVPFLQHVASAKNAFEALDILNKEKIDLIFLDIQMPGMLGTNLLNNLDKKPMAIFITAYPQYAIEGFELEAIDYLMKPVSMERFVKACNKALSQAKAESALQQQKIVANPDEGFFFVNADYSLVKIMTKNVLYIEGMKDYVKIFLADQKKPIITKTSLTGLEEKIGSEDFVRIHKSYIINTNHVKSIRNHEVMIQDQEIPISANKLTEVLEKIGYKE